MTRQEFSKSTKLKAFLAAKGLCKNCGIKLSTANVEFHHDKECTFGGDAKLDNCVPLCKNCHRAVTKQQAPVIAKSSAVRAKNLGIKPKRKSSFQTNRDGAFKKRMDGTVVRR
jgi:5-methylcytosine-specific restriction endonuclease McrA